jgi:hypothetical protein
MKKGRSKPKRAAITKITIEGFERTIEPGKQHGVRWWAEIRKELQAHANELYDGALQSYQQRRQSKPTDPQPWIASESRDPEPDPVAFSVVISEVPAPQPEPPRPVEEPAQDGPFIDWSLENLEWSFTPPGLGSPGIMPFPNPKSEERPRSE